MANADLRRLWAAVFQDFEQAMTFLPIPPVESAGRMRRLKEYLHHNELELALDELEGLAHIAHPPPGRKRLLAC